MPTADSTEAHDPIKTKIDQISISHTSTGQRSQIDKELVWCGRAQAGRQQRTGPR